MVIVQLSNVEEKEIQTNTIEKLAAIGDTNTFYAEFVDEKVLNIYYTCEGGAPRTAKTLEQQKEDICGYLELTPQKTAISKSQRHPPKELIEKLKYQKPLQKVFFDGMPYELLEQKRAFINKQIVPEDPYFIDEFIFYNEHYGYDAYTQNTILSDENQQQKIRDDYFHSGTYKHHKCTNEVCLKNRHHPKVTSYNDTYRFNDYIIKIDACEEMNQWTFMFKGLEKTMYFTNEELFSMGQCKGKIMKECGRQVMVVELNKDNFAVTIDTYLDNAEKQGIQRQRMMSLECPGKDLAIKILKGLEGILSDEEDDFPESVIRKDGFWHFNFQRVRDCFDAYNIYNSTISEEKILKVLKTIGATTELTPEGKKYFKLSENSIEEIKGADDWG